MQPEPRVTSRTGPILLIIPLTEEANIIALPSPSVPELINVEPIKALDTLTVSIVLGTVRDLLILVHLVHHTLPVDQAVPGVAASALQAPEIEIRTVRVHDLA